MRPHETLVYVFTRFDIPYAVNYLATRDIQAPLWLALFWIWRHVLAGDTEFARAVHVKCRSRPPLAAP